MIIYIWWLHSNFQLLKIKKTVRFFVWVILPFYARTLQDNCIEHCVYVVFLHLHLGQQHCRWIFGAFIQFSFVFHILGHLLCLENKPFFNWQICFDLGINIPSIWSCLDKFDRFVQHICMLHCHRIFGEYIKHVHWPITQCLKNVSRCQNI